MLAAKYSGVLMETEPGSSTLCWQEGRGPQGLTRWGNHAFPAPSKALGSTGRQHHVAWG